MGKLMKQLKPYWLQIVIITVLVFAQMITELYLPTLMADIVNEGVVTGDTDYIIRIGGFMLIIALLGGLLIIMATFLASRVGVRFAKDIRGKVFKKISTYSLHEVDQFGTSSLITRSTNDITQVQNVVVMLLRIAMRAPLMAVGSIVMALSKDVPLTFVIIGAVILMSISIALIASKALPLFTTVQKKVDGLNLVLRERLTGMRVIRAFNKTDHESARFETANRELTDVSIKVNKIMAIMWPMVMFFFNITTIALVWFGAIRIDTGNMMVGDLMAFIQYAMQIMFAVIMLVMVFIMVPRAQASAVRINEVLEVDSEIGDPKKILKANATRGYVEYKNVSFSYHSDHGAQEAAIKNLSFTSKPGEITAIIGGTGSGKSTLVNLLPRFYDTTEGEILVNGVNVKDMGTKDLRSKIGFVAQKAVLFSGSIHKNMVFGKEGASEDEIEHALKVAQGYDFVMEKEVGYESELAQGGMNLSGGQKQRLSIARALIKKPEIYIFDDSFSALDFKTESNLRSELRKEIRDATVLLVAQRVTTVMDADQIIVLDEGEAVGIGTHQELLATNQVYKEIVLSQLSEEEIA